MSALYVYDSILSLTAGSASGTHSCTQQVLRGAEAVCSSPDKTEVRREGLNFVHGQLARNSGIGGAAAA